MNIAHFPRRVEIAMWEAIIPVLKTSPAAANLLLGVYSLFLSFRSMPHRRQVLVWSVTGLVLGFLLGLLFSPFALGA